MPIVSTGQITIVDHNDVTISTVQPVSPNVDQLWLDSSVVPNQMKRWNGATWVDAGVTPDYVAARGEGLLTNGTGLLGNNFNFPGFTFDASEAYGCAGSFTTKLYSYSMTSELMPCNSDDIYRLTVYAKQKKGTPTNNLNQQYIFLEQLDIDKKQIQSSHILFFENTLTTLAQDLKPGDATVYLTNAANYRNAAGGATHYRRFIFWDYRSDGGYLYPPETYSRNGTSSDTWSDGGVNYVSNTITLRVPWAGPTKPAGTLLSNGTVGGTYLYVGVQGHRVPEEWTRYSTSTKLWAGAAYLKIGFLTHWDAPNHIPANDAINNTIYFSNFSFAKDMQENIIKQSTAPSHNNGRLWLDTSVTPNILKRSNGTSWVNVTPTTAAEIGAENTILKQTTAPAHLDGRLWLDTSVTPNILKRSTGSAWLVISENRGVGKNLIVVSRASFGKYLIETTGVLGTAGDHSATDFIPVAAETSYVLSSPALHQVRFVYYNSSKVRLSGVLYAAAQGTQKVIKTPVDAAFVRISLDEVNGRPLNATQFEFGSIATDWVMSQEDVTASVTAAQTTANNAQSSATNANNLLSDLSNDNLLTPAEKQVVRKEWEIIAAEKAGIETQGTLHVLTTETNDYTSAFSALANYLQNGAWVSGIPAWISDANLATNTAITGSVFRTNFKNYYDKRQILLNKITSTLDTRVTTAQTAANTAKTAADTAQTAADTAKNAADTAQAAVDKLSNDNLLTPAEKQVVRKEWEIIAAEQPGIEAQGTLYAITTEKIAYTSAFTALANYLHAGTWSSGIPAWISDANMASDTVIVGSTFRTNFKNYYNARQDLLNKITSLLDNRVTTAQTAVTTATNTLNQLADDNYLTPLEKHVVRKEWDTLADEKAGLEGRADLYLLTVEKNAYSTAFSALAEYLNSNVDWVSGPPSWISDANMATTTVIVGTTFRSTFKSFYAARQALLDKITDSIGTRVYDAEQQITPQAIWTTVKNGLKVGSRNLIPSANIYVPSTAPEGSVYSTSAFNASGWADPFIEALKTKGMLWKDERYTLTYTMELIEFGTAPTSESISHGFVYYSATPASVVDFRRPLTTLHEKVTVSQTFIAPTEQADQIWHLYTGRQSTSGLDPITTNTVRFTDIKLERGDFATDWTPAPEDVNHAIFAEAKSQVQQSANQILSDVEKTYHTKADQEAFVTTLNTTTALTEESWGVTVTTINQKIVDTAKDITTYTDKLQTSFTVDEAGAHIRKSASENEVLIDDDGLDIMTNGVRTAWFENGAAHNKQLSVKTSLEINAWQIIQDDQGNLNFRRTQ